MAVLSPTCRLVYFPIPKVACTSVKTVLWALEPKTPRERLAQVFGPKQDVHHHPNYQTVPYDAGFSAPDGYETVALIRDPVLRLRSAWSNKVNADAFDRWNQSFAIKQAGLPLNPDFSTFLENFDAYTLLSRSARLHTRPHWLYLGPDFSTIDHLFKLEDSAAFFAMLGERSGRPVAPSFENTAQADGRDGSVTATNIDQLRALTTRDYDLMKGAYSFDAAVEKLRA